MKRKRRTSDQVDEDRQLCDLILIDTNGRSIKVHKALLIDKSDYFAKILSDNNLKELQLNEKYLIELIQYLYNNESDEQQISFIRNRNQDVSDNDEQLDEATSNSSSSSNNNNNILNLDSNVDNDDTEILMQLLALSKKYSFCQLYQNLKIEIEYKLSPSTVLTVYRCAVELEIEELKNSTRLMILSWLPRLQNSNLFYDLTEESINNIFNAEDFDIDNECKLNALSAWWSHNMDADMTDLWFKLITCSIK